MTVVSDPNEKAKATLYKELTSLTRTIKRLLQVVIKQLEEER